MDGWSGALNINKASLIIISQQHHKYTSSSSQVKDPRRWRDREAARLIGLVERVREVRQLVLLLLGLLFACLLVLTLLLPASLSVCA